MLTFIKRILRGVIGYSRLTFTTEVYGTKIYYKANTDIGWQLLTHGNFEKSEIEICSSFLTADSVVMDVGANIGLHTVGLSRAVPEGLLIAIEASPSTYANLLRNTSALPNVLTLNAALSSTNGVAEFFEASDNAYSGLKNTGLKQLRRRIRVPCYAGDYLLQPLLAHRLDLIKIDVEGFETEVLRGFEKTIARFRPTIFCEIYQGTGTNPDAAETISLLTSAGYAAYVIHGSKLVSYERHDDAFYNYLFVPLEKLARYSLPVEHSETATSAVLFPIEA